MRLSVHRTRPHPGPTVLKNHRPPLLKAAGLTVVSAGAGAATEFLLDPERGHARRAWIRAKAVHTAHAVNHSVVGMSRDVANRGRGVAAGTRYRIAGRWTDDAVLHDRVRAELGRHLSHPHAVQVSAQNRTVMLTGDVLAAEAERACRAISRIPGVKHVEARWTVYDEPGVVPTLQGKRKTSKT